MENSRKIRKNKIYFFNRELLVNFYYNYLLLFIFFIFTLSLFFNILI